MLEKFIFENHLGQRFEGLPNGVYMNANTLRDYSWSHETINGRISRFYMATKSRKIPLVIKCDSEEEAISVKNRLHELAEADIEARIPGKIFVGDFYTSGYITASAKKNYLINKRLCYIDLTLVSDDPSWYRERVYPFFSLDSGGSSSASIGGTDYPYGYPYDYALSLTGRSINCETVGSSPFRILIYGAITNPVVIIGGHTYAMNCTVGQGETLLIDSLTKTITLTTASGQKVNVFDSRGRDSYIFEPIPAGENLVSYTGAFGFELTVIEKRSEPKWT